MNTRTIVTVLTAALLSVGLVPISSAEDKNAGMPDGIEVITVYGKRPAPTIATTCINAVMADITEHQKGESNFDNGVPDSGQSDAGNARRAIKQCVEQAASSLEGQI